MKIGVYAGSFDPLTNGHLDIAIRASRLLDRLIIAIGVNPNKQGLFSIDERMMLIEDAIKDYPNIAVMTFQGLLVHFCQSQQAQFVIRGLRSEQDFPLEFSLGLANRYLANDIETVLLLADSKNIFVSSSLIKEIAMNGGDVSGLLPQKTHEFLMKKFQS